MTKQKKHIEILTSPEQIDAFFKAVGRDDLADGFDIHSNKIFSMDSGKSKGSHKNFKLSKAKRFTPQKNDRYIDGYATTPDVDWVKDSVSLSAMKGAEKHLLRKGTNTVFYNHDTEQAIGKVVGVWVDKKGMFVQIIISKAEDVKNIWTKIKEKILSSYSIRFIAKKVKVERDGDYNVINYSIEKMDMLEVSVVGLPMNKEANIVNVMGKSRKFRKSIKSLFKQKGVKDMTKEKRKTITSVVKEILPEMLKDGMADSLKEFGKNLTEQLEGMFVAKEVVDPEAEKKALEEEVKSLKKQLKLKGKKKVAKKKVADEEDEEDEESDSMKAEIKSLKKKLAKKAEGKKKGAVADEDDDSDDNNDVTKTLKDIDDVATCSFVLKAMHEDNSLYDALTDGEKQKCRKLYFQMMAEDKKSK